MREIKFRVWHNGQGNMYWFDLAWGNKWYVGNGWLCVVPWGEKRIHHPDNRIVVDPDSVEIMQFTGLHDKNGKEIYEGDIVKDNWGGGIGAIQDMREVSRLLSDGFLAGQENDDGSLYDAEVIGNIYENPELLEGK